MMRTAASATFCWIWYSRMRSKSSTTSGASSTRATSCPLFLRHRPWRRLTSDSIFEVQAHLVPRSGLAGGDDAGKPSIGFDIEIGPQLFLLGLFGQRFQNKAVGGFTCALGCAGDTGLQFFGYAYRCR